MNPNVRLLIIVSALLFIVLFAMRACMTPAEPVFNKEPAIPKNWPPPQPNLPK